MTRLLALACLIALTVAAPSASAASAPARVAFPVVSETPHYGSGGSAFGGVALPGGSVVAFAFDHPGQTTLVLKLQRNGALDPAFGSAGIVRLATPGQLFVVDRAERVADGKLLIAGSQRELATSSPPRIVLVRLLASGAPDPSFGASGFVLTAIRSPAGGLVFGSPSVGVAGMAVAPDGSIVVTGAALSPTATNPLNPPTDWVVAKLSPDGVPDAGFGVVTIPVGSGRSAAGASVVVTPTGSIVVLGRASQAPGSFATVAVLAGLTAAGMPDPAFNGGAPALVPHYGASRIERHAGGALDLIGDAAIVRFGAGGAVDTSFAAGGKLAFDQDVFLTSYVATPDGGALISGPAVAQGPPPADPRPPVDPDRRIALHRLTASGTIAGSRSLQTPFGGGTASPYYSTERPVAPQNTFHGDLLRRDDGSYLLLGGLGIGVSTGRMDTLGAPFVAAQAFTSMLTPDRSFGGPQQPATFKVQLRRQRELSSAARPFIALRVTASQAGIVSMRVRDRANRLLASGTHPVYAPGTVLMSVRVTKSGRSVLRRAWKGLRIAVRHDFRDILATTTTGVTKGRLR